ncbi:hypothetical protein GCM10010377_73370 [Streptomyces viridiviolaceus]|nr:hypothetical protein GCM10010377_73370 [Streptomyces viridiviolaceus]
MEDRAGALFDCRRTLFLRPLENPGRVLACILQLTDTDEGARFWWQYAAGAGQAAAAYCVYLHHLALGERNTAEWWHRRSTTCYATRPGGLTAAVRSPPRP